MWRGAPLVERAQGYGFTTAQRLDGNDVAAVRSAADVAVAACRAGEGPVLIEAMTYRIHGHYEGDATPYVDAGELAAAQAGDPIARASAVLEEAGRAGAVRAALDDAAAEMDAAVTAGLAAPWPDPATVLEDVHA
jgi:TPP-dependent pyruvate/acetoin dehydrogenase alpha subunit